MARLVNAEGSAYREVEEPRKIEALLARGFVPVEAEEPVQTGEPNKHKQRGAKPQDAVEEPAIEI